MATVEGGQPSGDNVTATGESVQPSGQLRRAIGPRLLLFFVIGDILGTGIYALTGVVAGEVGGAAWMSFAMSFLVALVTAASYVELVGKYPRAAGAALYTHRAFKIPFLTFMVAFAVMCSGLTSASAAATAFSGTYFRQFWSGAPKLLIGLAFILVIMLINFRGVAESVKANVVMTCVELSGLLLVIVLGAWALGQGKGDVGAITSFRPGENPLGLVITGASLAFFALVGFEDSVNMVEETQNPQRNFPRALFTGITITGVIYILVAALATIHVPIDRLKTSTGPLLEVVKVAAPAFPLRVFAFIALFAVANSALINMLMASRLIYGMSKERVLPSVLGAVHPRRRTPWVAILFTTAIAVGLVVWGNLAGLGGTTALLLLMVFTLVNAAVLVLRRERVEHEHYRAPTFLPVIGIVTCAYLASPLSGRSFAQYKLALILLGIGVVLFVVNLLVMRGRVGELNPEHLGKS